MSGGGYRYPRSQNQGPGAPDFVVGPAKDNRRSFALDDMRLVSDDNLWICPD